jgi:hypothetical protein
MTDEVVRIPQPFWCREETLDLLLLLPTAPLAEPGERPCLGAHQKTYPRIAQSNRPTAGPMRFDEVLFAVLQIPLGGAVPEVPAVRRDGRTAVSPGTSCRLFGKHRRRAHQSVPSPAVSAAPPRLYSVARGASLPKQSPKRKRRSLSPLAGDAPSAHSRKSLEDQ